MQKGEFFLEKQGNCTYKQGSLPSCAPLALGVVPVQQSSEPAYDRAEAFARGTLFPGLDLPFMDYAASGEMESTPRHELMALDFVTQELALYLDTHPDDEEAFETWKCFTALAEEGRRRYVERFGPVLRGETAMCSAWKWVDSPWPWEYEGKGGNA